MSDFLCTTNLGGGLGNQLFQAANVLAQAKKNNAIPIFTKTNNPHSNVDYTNNIYRDLIFTDKVDINRIYTEENWNYANINPVFDGNIYFQGYYQSSKNFLGYDSYIRDTFSPTSEFIETITKKYPNLKSKNTLSIHVRRGDYLLIPSILPVVSKEYIDTCVGNIGEYSHIFIFSNDLEWCSNNLKYENSTLVRGLLDYEELWMMSLCSNNIISNSTFSWWGAFLNYNKGNTVIAPKIWFGPDKHTQRIDKWDSIYENDWVIQDCDFINGYIC